MTVASVTLSIVDHIAHIRPMLGNTSFPMRDNMTMVFSGEVMNCMIQCHVRDHMIDHMIIDHMIGLRGHMTLNMVSDQG